MDRKEDVSHSRSESTHSSGGGRRSRSRSRSPVRSRSLSLKRDRDRKAESVKSEDSYSRENKAKLSKDTNSNDPRSVRSRVFVGNLGNVSKQELLEHFQRYGEVSGVSIHANFGFVQYTNAEDADVAVEKTHGTTIFGKRVDCNIASERRKPQAKDADSPIHSRNRSPETGDRGRSLSPRDRGRPRRLPSPKSKYDEMLRRDYDRLGDREMYMRGRYDDRVAPPHMEDRYRGFPDEDYDWKPGYRDGLGRAGMDDFPRRPPQPPKRPPNDCEIVLASKGTSAYGEMIENRLRSIGVLSRIVLPEPDIPLTEVLEGVSRRGALYSILVTEPNEVHRSCTLNILHGTAQEHRNMPLEDALALVARNFESYLRTLKDRGAFVPGVEDSGLKTSLVQDPEIAFLLKIAAGGRVLSVGEIEKLIDALRKYKSEVESKYKQSIGNGSERGEYTTPSPFPAAAPHPLSGSFGYPRGESVPSYNSSGLPTSSVGYPSGFLGTPFTADSQSDKPASNALQDNVSNFGRR